MSRIAALLCLGAACAGPSAESVPPAPTHLAAPLPPPPPFDAKSFAAAQPTPADCEAAARALHATNPDQGWQALNACAVRGRWPRGEFTLLQRLTAGDWDDDLQRRPDAPALLARVIAARGGDVDGDLPQAQKSRAPLFTLAAAMKQPDTYRGRYVLVRATLDELQAPATALLLETSLRATAHEVQVGNTHRSRSEGNWGKLQHSGTREWSTVKNRYENERTTTGRHALGKLAQPDPFLEPGQEFLFLARFNGVQAQGADQPDAALLDLVEYWKPAALMIE